MWIVTSPKLVLHSISLGVRSSLLLVMYIIIFKVVNQAFEKDDISSSCYSLVESLHLVSEPIQKHNGWQAELETCARVIDTSEIGCRLGH